MSDDFQVRKLLRLPGYDYSQSGFYFITICVQDRECRFGRIDTSVGADPGIGPTNAIDQMIQLNNQGELIKRFLFSLKEKFPSVDVTEYVIMPNHLHLILEINNTGPIPGSAPTAENSIPKIIQWFKIKATNEYLRHIKAGDFPRINRQLWQRGYYERIIRDEDELSRTIEYIIRNPEKWFEDELYRA